MRADIFWAQTVADRRVLGKQWPGPRSATLTGLMTAPVLDAMIGYLRREAEIGGYETAAETAARLDGCPRSVSLPDRRGSPALLR